MNSPAIVESIGQVPMTLHPNLAAVFKRVEADKRRPDGSTYTAQRSVRISRKTGEEI